MDLSSLIYVAYSVDHGFISKRGHTRKLKQARIFRRRCDLVRSIDDTLISSGKVIVVEIDISIDEHDLVMMCLGQTQNT